MRNYILLLILIAPCLSFADFGTCTSGAFAGVGLGIGSTEMSHEAADVSSKFNSQGYMAEGGIQTCTSSTFGFLFSAEYGQAHAINKVNDDKYLEVGTLDYYSGKAAITYGVFSIGPGYRRNSVNIKSVSTSPSESLESDYTGWTPFGFANVNLNYKNRYKAVVEVQHVTGSLKGSNVSGSAEMKETSLSFRFFVVFE